MKEIKFIGRNYSILEKDKEYVIEKVSKHTNLLTRATSLTCVITKNNTDRGKKRNFKVEFTVSMPKAFIKVEDRDNDIDKIIDNIEVTLKRRLKRYRDQFDKWNKTEPWKAKELHIDYNDNTEEIEDIKDLYNYENYAPKIKSKEYADDTPISPAEAIERMELLGHTCFLFKNIENNKYATIYKRMHDGYGMIQPKD